MSGQETGKIVISVEDLKDAKIDETLELQRASMAGAIQPASGEKKPVRRLIYTTWFYLMLAGAAGALAGWAVIEPNFSDGIIFTGSVESVNPDSSPDNIRSQGGEIRGEVTVSGVEIWIVEGLTTIVEQGKPVRHLKLEDLKPGDVVKVMGGEISGDDSALIGNALRREPAGTPAQTYVPLGAMEMHQTIFALLLFPTIAGFVALALGAVEGLVCRTFSRAAWCAGIGLLIGLAAGGVSILLGGLAYGLIGMLGVGQGGVGAFLIQMFRRGLAWTLAGMGMGLGQGIALKSRKLAFNGFLGGIVGGLVGGLLFDPIGVVFTKPELMQGAMLSRAVGLTIIGAVVGLMMGLTDLLTRDAWLKVVSGPLRGKEFSFNRTPIRLGSSPKCEIYLFKDAKIDPVHAVIDKLRDTYEITDESSTGAGVLINGNRVVKRRRLVDGDQIQIGDSEFRYSTREAKAS